MIKKIIIVAIAITVGVSAIDFESKSYYSRNYVYDAQVYSVNTFVSENIISHEVGKFVPYVGYTQYQGLDKYRESDFGVGSEYKVSDEVTVDIGSWYYYYYSVGGHYFEPYVSVNYDWVISPTVYVGILTYNKTARATVSFDYSKMVTDKIELGISPVLGTVDYGDRYGYYGIRVNVDYKLNKYFSIFSGGEVDKPFNLGDNSSVYTYSFGLKLSI